VLLGWAYDIYFNAVYYAHVLGVEEYLSRDWR